MIKNEIVRKRNINLDIIRSIAVLFVICVHYLMNSEFYTAPLIGKRMFIMTMMRTLFITCVPLFLMLTGYLMNHKKLTHDYYKGLFHILFVYVFASIACSVYSINFLGTEFTIKDYILGLTGFKLAPYSWYINMYIGLFILIPFLNIIWHEKNDKHYHLTVIGTFFILTTLTTTILGKLLPNWWSWQTWPILFYFIGCYFNQHSIDLDLKYIFLLLIFFITLLGIYNFNRSYGQPFIVDSQVDWFGWQTLLISILLFLFFLKLKLKNIPDIINFLIFKISECSLGIYLVSSIFDNYFYGILNTLIKDVPSRLTYFFIIIFLVFICSLLLSQSILIVLNIINWIKLNIKKAN